jgi:hypothetical protein
MERAREPASRNEPTRTSGQSTGRHDGVDQASLIGSPGNIATRINNWANRKGQGPAAVKSAAYEEVRATISAALGRGEGSGAFRLEKPYPTEFAGRSRKGPLPDDQPLPGFEQAIAERTGAEDEERERQLTEELLKPNGDIEKAAGETERNSPLFENSDANPQSGLFGTKKPQS